MKYPEKEGHDAPTMDIDCVSTAITRLALTLSSAIRLALLESVNCLHRKLRASCLRVLAQVAMQRSFSRMTRNCDARMGEDRFEQRLPIEECSPLLQAKGFRGTKVENESDGTHHHFAMVPRKRNIVVARINGWRGEILLEPIVGVLESPQLRRELPVPLQGGSPIVRKPHLLRHRIEPIKQLSVLDGRVKVHS